MKTALICTTLALAALAAGCDRRTPSEVPGTPAPTTTTPPATPPATPGTDTTMPPASAASQ